MRIFLTGGTGFIGQYLTQALLRRGWEVCALVRNPHGGEARLLRAMGATLVQGDVTDRAGMRAPMTGAEMVVHNAAWYEVGITTSAQKLMRAINVTGTDNVLGLAQELGIPRSVYVSSCVYYGDSGPEKRDETYRRQKPYHFYYEQSKAEAHEVARRYQQTGLPLVIVCPAHVLGPNDHSNFGYFLRVYLNRLMTPVGFSPEMIFSPAHVADISEGIALSAEKGRLGEVYNLAGDSMSLREMFEIWNTQPGGFKVKWYVPRWLAALALGPMGPVLRWAGLPAFFSLETVVSSSISYNFSGAKAQRELGWSYRSAKDLWRDIINEELTLLARRSKRGLVMRLKPAPVEAANVPPAGASD